jgi:hypothetical protein
MKHNKDELIKRYKEMIDGKQSTTIQPNQSFFDFYSRYRNMLKKENCIAFLNL